MKDSCQGFDDIEDNKMLKQEDALHGFDHLLETLSDPETIGSSRQSWNLLKNPSGICLFRVEPNDDFTNLSLGSKVFIRRDLRMNFVNEENFPVDPKEIDMNPTLESLSQLRRILNHFTNYPQPKLKSSTHQLLQQAFHLLSKFSGIDEVLEPIRKLILEAIATSDPLTETVIPKTEPEELENFSTVLITEFKTEPFPEPDKTSNQDSDANSEDPEKVTVDPPTLEKKKRGPKPKSKPADGGLFPCEHCDRVFLLADQRRQHFYRAHVGPVFCDKCGKSFKSRIALNKHMEIHDEKRNRVKCPRCDLMIFPHGLKKHIRITHDGYKPHTCSYCGRSFTAIKTLRDHEEAHRNKSKRIRTAKYQCPKCSLEFDKGGSEFTKHMSSCMGVEIEKEERTTTMYRCFMCNKKYPSKNHCAKHLETAHSYRIENIKKFCFECQKEVEDPFMHSRIHNCPFQCTICGMRFAKETKLANHEVKKHKNGKEDRPFKCETCSLSFKCSNHLQSHVVTMHRSNDEKPFECTYCHKRFGLRSSLNGHVKLSHEKPYRFVCGYCTEKFKTLIALRRHCKYKHGENCMYPCSDCSERLSTLTDLKNHREAVHGDTIVIHKYHSQ